MNNKSKSSKKSNPYSTGGGGTTFEQLVGALYLVSLLNKDTPRGLDGGIIKEVKFQQRWTGALLDDLVIISTNRFDRKLALQIKHKLTFSDAEYNTEFKKVIDESWKTFNGEFGWKFNPELDRIGIGIGTYNKDIDTHLQVVLEWAKTSSSSKEFISKVNSEISSNKKREYFNMFKKLLSEVKGSEIEDIELWKFLSCLVVIHFDLEHEGSRDLANCWDKLKTITKNNDPETSKLIFNNLKSIVSQYARSAGSINLDVLQRKIPNLNNVANEIKREIPEVYINLREDEKNPCKSGDLTYPTYRVYFINRGKIAAEQVRCYILIGSNEKIDIWQHRFHSARIEELDSTHYNLDEFIKSYPYKEVVHFVYPNERTMEKIYPFKECSNGYLAILESDINKVKKIIALTIDDNGFAKQEFEVLTDETKKYFKETESEFNLH